MGNCQAADAAMVVIQHPTGREERLYWPVSAKEVMRSNPGHYVGLVTLCRRPEEERGENASLCFTHVKLLRAKDMLLLGQVYRVLTPGDVMKGLWAKKYTRMKKSHHISEKEEQGETQGQVGKQERHGEKGTPSARALRHWRPSLQSISEGGSGCNTPLMPP